MINFQQAGVVYNPHRETAASLSTDTCAWLESRGIHTWSCAIDEDLCLQHPTDMLVVYGGDGSILRVAQQAAPLDIPILGINLGRVGFLTEAQPDVWQRTLTDVLDGKAEIEERAMICVSLIRDGQVIAEEHALNDAVVSRSALARTVRLYTYIDGAYLTRYVTDSLILATATGSTAYAYAVGGPILPPWLENMLLIPVAPHLSLERPLVLDPESVVEIKVNTHIPGMLSVDGRMEGNLHDEDIVRIECSERRARFLRLGNRGDYYKTLVARLSPRNGDEHDHRPQ